MNTKWLLIFLSAFLGGATEGKATLLPPSYISAVVAIGSNQLTPVTGGVPQLKWVTEGTGFFYGYKVHDDPEPSKRKYAIFLVTAAHVIRGHIAVDAVNVSVRLDAVDTSAKTVDIPIKLSEWFFHPDPNVDLAAVSVSPNFLKENGLQSMFFANDEMASGREKLKELGTSAGDGVFVLGFPMGLSGAQKNYVIVRQGAVARISEFLDGAAKSFLIDSFVFPGNSGGPVILRPEIAAIDGTKSNGKALLIGVVQSYQPYTDVAISAQTKHPRITFEENSGLAVVLPVDGIDEMLRQRVEAIKLNLEKGDASPREQTRQ